MISVIKPVHPNFIDIEGLTFGRWFVLSFAGNGKWNCICECGTERSSVKGELLRKGKTRSCGCFNQQVSTERATTHGLSQTVEYKTYMRALGRCTNINNPDYDNYGGRGIEFKFTTFNEFYELLGPRPEGQYSLDRYPNNDGHYESGNVRWATPEQQAGNRREARTWQK